MKSEKLDRRPIVASILASLIVLSFGLTYRVLAARLGVTTSSTPIAQRALEQFTLQISDWTGQDMPLDAAIVRGTSTDAHINRRYSRANGQESVSLYIACGIRTAEIVYHQPIVCYPGNGWTLVDRSAMELPVHNGMKLPCSIFRFSRGELEKQRVTVLHYWIVDGRFCSDVSLLRSRLWRITSRVNYIAQVQIISSSRETRTADSAKRIVSEFAVDSAPSIAEIFERIQKEQSAHSTGPVKKGDSL